MDAGFEIKELGKATHLIHDTVQIVSPVPPDRRLVLKKV